MLGVGFRQALRVAVTLHACALRHSAVKPRWRATSPRPLHLVTDGLHGSPEPRLQQQLQHREPVSQQPGVRARPFARTPVVG